MADNDQKSPGVSIREKMEALDASMKTAEREEAARRRQAKIYDAARKDIQKTLDDARKVLGDAEFNRAMAQERMSPAELHRWSKQMEREHAALEKRCRDAGIEYLEQDTQEAARRAKENAARRSITRAKALLASIDAATARIAADTQINMSKTLKSEAVKSSRNEEKKLEIGFDVELDSISPDKVKVLANEDFHGGTYTNKICRGRDKLKQELERCVRLGQVNGWSISRLSKEMSKRVGISERESNRLIRTEMTRVSNEAALEQLKSCGAKFYKYIATMDSRTCEQCKALHGQVFPIDKAKSGVNFPPMHPNCRCRIVISADNETGEYDTSYVDKIVDKNIRKALDKWTSEGIEIMPDTLFAPDNIDSTRSLSNLPDGAYQTREESGFNQSVLRWYNPRGGQYKEFKAIYMQSMIDRGVHPAIRNLVGYVYTREVWREIPPVFVKLDSDTGVISSFNSNTMDLNLACNDGLRVISAASHELTHMLDYKIWRKDSLLNPSHQINYNFFLDARRLMSRGIEIDGVHYTMEYIRQLHTSPELSEELQLFNERILREAKACNPQGIEDYAITGFVHDAIQSLLGFEYGCGHSEEYCSIFADTYAETVANCGVAYICRLDALFSKLFKKGYGVIKGLFGMYGIKQIG